MLSGEITVEEFHRNKVLLLFVVVFSLFVGLLCSQLPASLIMISFRYEKLVVNSFGNPSFTGDTEKAERGR